MKKISSKKRILASVLALVLTTSCLCACRSNDDGKKVSSTGGSQSSGASSSYVASVTQKAETDVFSETEKSTTTTKKSGKPETTTTKTTTTTTTKKPSTGTSKVTTSDNATVTTSKPVTTVTSVATSTTTHSTTTSVQTTVDSPVDFPDKVNNGEILLNDVPQEMRILIGRINSAIKDFETKVVFNRKQYKPSDIANALTIISFTNLEDNYVSTEYSISVDENDYVTQLKLYYTKTRKQHEAENKKLEEVCREIIDGCTAENDYDAVLYFHDEIIKRCRYDISGENMLSAYGCLVDGKAICEGYAKALILLCSKYGIECMPVVGSCKRENEQPEPHMWNLVKLEDSWYHIDLTWDDPVIKSDDDSYDDYISYNYFALSDEEIQKDHEISRIEYVKYPDASDSNSDYFEKNELTFENFDDAVLNFQMILNNSVLNNSRYVRVRITDKEEFEKLCRYLFESFTEGKKNIFVALYNAKEQTGNEDFRPKKYSKFISADKGVLTLVLNYE